MTNKARWLAAVAGLLMIVAVQADELELRPDYPTTYVVKAGDTLWDISAKFLKSPWLWPRIWQHNPGIDNPHLIYPGDQLTLIFVNGQPRLVRKTVVRLSPQARPQARPAPIPTLPLNMLTPLMEHEQVLTPEMLIDAGRVIGNNDATLMAHAGDTVFVRGQGWAAGESLAIYRKGDTIEDPETGKPLGWRAVVVGNGVIRNAGDPAAMVLTGNRREIRNGDIILPYGEHNLLPTYFQLKAPWDVIEGQVIASPDKYRLLGEYQVAVINRGIASGLEPGHVLAIYQPGEKVLDSEAPKYSSASRWTEKIASWFTSAETVRLPEQRIGEMMVFRAYDELSLALITRADRPVGIGNGVTNP